MHALVGAVSEIMVESCEESKQGGEGTGDAACK